MKIEILDDKADEENQGKNTTDKNNDKSVALDGTGIPNESEASKQKLEEADKVDSREDGEKPANEGEIAPIIDGKKQIQMSIWVWEEVLKFIRRMEMADRISFVCHSLKKLCWPRLHGNKVTPHWVEQLYFAKGETVKGRRTGCLLIRNRMVSIATHAPPPDYIQGFKNIRISYMDSDVLQFVCDIKPLLTNIHLLLGHYVDTLLNLRQLLTVLDGSHISSLSMGTSITISALRQNFPGLLENTPALSLPSFCHEDRVALNGLILSKMDGGKSFILKTYSIDIPVDDIRKAFRTATQPQSFLFTFSFIYQPLNVFRLENEVTGEVLALEANGFPNNDYDLYRCPRGEDQQWREKAKKIFTEEATRFWM